MKNSGDKVFDSIPVGPEEPGLFNQFLGAHDFSANSRRAFTQDERKLVRWFAEANKEPFKVSRVTTRDVADFRDHLRRDQGQAVATVNRALVTVRRFFAWLADQGHVRSTRPGRSSCWRRSCRDPNERSTEGRHPLDVAATSCHFALNLTCVA